MTMNPIIRRELIDALRTRRALAAQALLAALLATLVLLRWPADAVVDITLVQSQQVLRIFGYGLMIGMILLAPIFPATSIVRERTQGTLALLLNSPMSPWAILTGKLIGTLGFILILLIISMPPAAACFAMGGVAFGQVVTVYTILGLAAVQYATIALAVSSHAASTDSAMRGTYSLVLLLCVLTLIPYQLRQGLDVEPLASIADWLRCFSPIAAMMETLGQGGLVTHGLAGPGDITPRYMLLACISIVAASLWTGVRLSRRILDKPRAAPPLADDFSATQSLVRKIFFMWFFDPTRQSRLIGPFTNAVMVKEFRSRRFGRSKWLIRLTTLTLITSMGIVLTVTMGTLDWGPATLATLVVAISASLVALIAPALAAGVISSERETGGWQLLQMTPLSPISIVAGKLVSVFLPLLLILLATLPSFVVIYLMDPKVYRQPIQDGAITLSFLALFITLSSAAVGSFFSRTLAATVTAYIVMLTITAATFLAWLGRADLFSHTVVQNILRINPIAAALQAVQAPGFAGYNLIPANWWIMGIGSVLSLFILIVRTWRLTKPQ